MGKEKRSLGLSVGSGVLKSIGILFLTYGANEIQKQDYLVGGACCVIGFVLLVVDDYVL
jgi:formate/nitrite transporter FocA (FNT family)